MTYYTALVSFPHPNIQKLAMMLFNVILATLNVIANGQAVFDKLTTTSKPSIT